MLPGEENFLAGVEMAWQEGTAATAVDIVPFHLPERADPEEFRTISRRINKLPLD